LYVECKRRGVKLNVDVSGSALDVTFDGKHCPGIETIHELIFGQVMQWLRHRPGDGHGLSKIGFAMH
jgi:hypothetical protein